MRYDDLEENYHYTLRAGCWGCFFYLVVFFSAGGVIMYYDLPIILSVPVVAVFVVIWSIFFVIARKLDRKQRRARSRK